MKKRTLVCFLIFTLCVFHFSITDTVFGQDPTPEELAQQVFDEHNQVLRRANVKQYLPEVIEGLKGELPLGLSPAGVIDFAVNSLKTDPTGAALKAIAQGAGLTLTDDHIAIIADADVQKVLADDTTKALLSLTGDNLAAGLDELLRLINESEAIDPGDGTKPDPAPPTIFITTRPPTTAQQGSFNIAFRTADVNTEDTVTVRIDSFSVEPVEAASYYSRTITGSRVQITQTAPSEAMPTIPGATVTLTLVANDGTADSSPASFVVTFATAVHKPTDPTPPDQQDRPVNLIPSPLNGKSRLGGVSLNKIYARGFIDKLLAESGFDPRASDALIAEAVDFVLNQIPEGFLPKSQIRYALTANTPQSVFGQNEPPQLDSENFGNAISPALTDLLYTNVIPENKYLASDNMNVYVRVPNALENGSVQFRLSGTPSVQGKRISPTAFKADTIPYTFKLEETLAATNLPAWPAVDPDDFPKIFREVVLRYSQEGLDGEYIALQMDPYDEDKGVVWKGDVGIIPGRNVFYYFEVTLMEPVMLNIVNPVALGEAIASPHGTHDEAATKKYTIASWAMPDPRNLQFQDRGIIDALLTPDVALEIARIYLLSQGGNQIPFNEFNTLTQLLGRNANGLLTEFENNDGYFDPKLASVFTVPDIDYDTESLWFANFDAIADGDYTVEAVVRNADGDDVDHIVVDFIGDSSAPEAEITFTPIANADVDTSGYWSSLNKANPVFVSTDKNDGPAALIDIGSVLDKDNLNNILGRDEGYLLYQVSGIDKDGNSITTWLPLTVESSMLASDLWDIAKEQLQGSPLLANIPEQYRQLVDSLWSLPFNAVLGLITPGLIQELGNPELAKLGIRPINDARAQFIVDLLGALVKDIDAIPLTYNEDRVMRMVFPEGEYGIRALGIDNLLNISSHIGATRLRIVKPEYDRSSITLASLGDINYNGKDDDYENNVIYANAQDLTLTISVDQRSGAENHDIAHPGTITVQYENADGDWVTIGDPIDLVEADHPVGTTFKHPWTVTDFDDLIGAGEVVRLRTITSNALDLTTTTPEADYFTIMLDNDVHPVDPKVLVVDVDDSSIVMTNPDSGAPQGTIQLIGYTPRRTVPATDTIRVEAKRMNDDAWKDIGTVELVDPAGMSGTDTAAIMFNDKALADVYVDDMLHIQDSGSYLKWVITVDTTLLDDTITSENLAAAHAASDPDGKSYAELDNNRYMVRAYAVGEDESDISDAVEGPDYTDMFSVDNKNDVGPLGPTVITGVTGDSGAVTPNADGSYTVGGLVDKYDPEVNSPVVTFTITPGAANETFAGVKLMPDPIFPKGTIIRNSAGTLLVPDEETGVITAEGSGEITVSIDVGTLMDDDDFVHNDTYAEDAYIENPDKNIYNPKGKRFSFQLHAIAYDEEMILQTHDRDADSGAIIDTVEKKIAVHVENSYRPDPGVLAISIVNSDGMVNPDSGAPQGELTFDVYTYGITSAPTKGIRVEVQRPIDGTWERITGTAEPSELVNVSEVAVTDLPDIISNSDGITNSGVIGALVNISEAEGGSPANLMRWTFTIDSRDLARLNADDEAIKLDDTINRGDGDAERDVTEDTNQYTVRAYALTPDNLNQVEYPKRDEYLERGGVEASFSLDNVDDVPPLGPTNITDVADHVGSLVANEDGSYTARGIVDDNVESTKLTFSIEPTAELITYEGGMIRLVQTGPDGAVTELPSASVDEGQLTVDIGLLENGAYMYYALVADEFGNWQVQGELDKPSPVITVHVLNFRVSDVTDLTVTAVDGESPDRLPLQETVGELQGRFPLKESIAVSFNVNNGSLTLADLTAVVVGGQPRDGDDYTAGSGDAANSFSLMANNLSEVADGWYTPHGRVTIRERFVDFPLATINLDNTGPMIIIETPTEGHSVDDLPTLLAGFGDGDLGSGVSDGSGVSAEDTAVVSLARLRPEEVVQDAVPIDVDQSMVEQNLVSVVYTRIDKLAGGAYQFTVQVADMLGNIGEASVNFAVEGEDPIVVITAPASGQSLDKSPAEITGFFSGGGEVTITNFTINGVELTANVDGNNFTYMPPEALAQGDHKVEVEVADGSGVTAQTALTFTVDTPGPTVEIHAVEMYDISMPVIAGSFSGDAEPVSLSLTLDGEVVSATEGENTFEFTPAAPLDDGEYTLVAVVTDAHGKTATATHVFTIRLPVPTVSIASPVAGDTYDHTYRHISGEFTGAGEIAVTLMIDDNAIEAAIDGNQFTHTLADKLSEGEHTVSVSIVDANGNTAQTSSTFSVVYPDASVSITSPLASETLDHTYRNISGEFSGVGDVTVSLMLDGTAVDAMVDGNQFTHTLADKLSEGEHTVSVMVTDANGETAEASTTFSVVYPEASVSIQSPEAGDTYDHTFSHISGEFSGVGEVAVSLMLDGEAVEATIEGNQFSADLSDRLSEGDHLVSVMVTDANGETAEASVSFSVVYPEASVSIQSPPAGSTTDHTFRHIAGEFSGVGEVVVNLMLDGEAVEATIEGNQFSADLSDKLSEGDHLVSVMVTDANGETAEASSLFSVVYPEASVSIQSPAAGDTYDHTFSHISGEFTGVDEVVVSLMLDGEVVEATIEDNQFSADLSDKLSEGDHVVSVMVTDANGETAEASSSFSVVYPEASVSIQSPAAGDTYDHTFSHISGEFTGVDEVAVSLMLDGEVVEATIEDNQFSADLSDKLSEGDHVVSVMVTDANGETAEASSSFSVVYPEASVSIQSPPAGSTTDHTFRHIAGEFSGVGEVAVSLMLDGEVVEATIDGNQFSADLSDKLSEGDHLVSVMVTDANGETAEASSLFSVVYPEASVSIQSPEAGDTYDHTFSHISGEFTGVGEVVVNLMLDGEVVEATIEDNQFSADLSDKLSEGDHVVSVMVTDANGETAEASSSFSVVYPDASVSIQSPPAGSTTDHTFRHIAGEFTGVGEVVVNLMLDGETVEATIEGNQFSADLSDKLSEGDHLVSVMVTDANGETAEASSLFSVVYPEASVSIQSPEAGDTYDHTFSHISGEFTGVGEVVVSLMLDGETVEATIEDNQFSADLSDKLSEGDHLVSVMVTDANGETAEASSSFSVVYPDATVSIQSPPAGSTTDHTFRHIAGEFTGVGAVVVNLMLDGEVVEATIEGNQFSADLSDKLSEGDHLVSVMVTDANGETAEASSLFSVVYPEASVSIQSPAAGHTYDHTFSHISGEFTGVGEVVVSLMLDGEAVEATIEGNQFSADLSDKLSEGDHLVSVMVTDANGETAEESVSITVVYPDASVSIQSPPAGSTTDHTFRHIAGEFSGVGAVVVNLMLDGEVVEATIEGNQFSADLSDKLSEGDHLVSVMVTDANGETAEASSLFSVVYPEASVSIQSPAAGHTYDHTFSHISGEFSGVGEVAVSLMLDGEAVEATIEGNQFSADLSDKLSEGDHVVSVMVTDANGETAEESVSITVVYPEASVSIQSPAAGDTYDHTFSHISGEFSGVGEVVVSLMLDGKAVEATIEDNQFSADLSDKLSEGDHLVSVMVTDANGETAEASSSFSVVYPDATVMLLSPTAGHTYTNGTPVISGEFTGVGEVKVQLTVDGKDAKVSVDGNQFTGELAGALGHGMHTVAVEVTDANGESAKTSAEFMVDLPPPTVAILSPAPGQTYGNDETINIRVEFTGMDASVTSFTINGEDVEVEPEDNMFTHTPDGLATGEYVVAVEVTDAANNKKAQDTVVFNVKLDATPPVISEVAPSGTLHDTWVNISVVVSDEESDITGVDFFIRNEDDTHKGFLPLGTVIDGAQNSATTQQIADGNVLTQGSFEPGTHTLQVIAKSEGGSSSHTWSFTVVTDNVKPTITSIAPSGTLHAGLPTISASAHDESGVAEIVITVMDSSGEAVEGKTQNDDEDGSVGITRADFMPEMPLDEGTYVVEVRATDTFGNTSSAKGGFTIDFDTAAPLITSSSPQNGARLMYAHDDEKRPTISITYGDAETGVNVDSIRFVFNDQLINLTDDQKSATQVIYMPPADLDPGQYTVKIEVSDNAQMQGNVSDEAEGAREANTAVYEFSFFVEHGEVPILKAAPFNYPNPFKDNTRISFVLARRSNVSITIYDVTERPVRTLVDNEVMEAGYYTRAADGSGSNAIGWDGKSSNGEDLARGIYFCQIMVTDGIEPEYAILKLALTR